MTEKNRILSPGYSDVPPGYIANVVTNLEMLTRPAPSIPAALPDGISLDVLSAPDLDMYRDLFRKIGADWLWASRLFMDDTKLSAILNDAHYEVFVVRQHGEDIGMVELDFRQAGVCELVFFGLVPGMTGKGLGRLLMNRTLELAWARPIQRMWLHTCTFDHPAALSFYQRAGFSPYLMQVEVEPDPRLTGHLPLEAAPHVPLIRPRE